MKLIIDIPEDVYKRTVFYHEFKDLNDCVESVKAIVNGTPLDDVKAKILKRVDEHCARTLEIFDNIGKAESEDK